MEPGWEPDPTLLTCRPRQLPPLRPPEGATGGCIASSFCKAWCLCSQDDPLCQDTALPSDLRRDTRLARAAGGALLSLDADEPGQLLTVEMKQDSHSPNAPSLSPPRRLPHQSLSPLPLAKLFPRSRKNLSVEVRGKLLPWGRALAQGWDRGGRCWPLASGY